MFLQLVAQAAANQPTVNELLEKYEQALGLLDKRITTSDTITESYSSAKDNKPQWSRNITELTLDGATGRSNAIAAAWFLQEEKNFDAEPYQRTRQMWDGKTGYSNWVFEKEGLDHIRNKRLIMSHTDRDKHELVKKKLPSGILHEGVLPGDNKSLADIIRAADTARVRAGTERIGDSDCYVIEAKGDNGRYTVWLDPQHGYHIARVKAEKTVGDIVWGNNRLSGTEEHKDPSDKDPNNFIASTAGHQVTVDDVSFKKIEGVWAPVEAVTQVRISFTNGDATRWKTHLRILEVDLNPDFDATDAFVANIPDGTTIIMPEARGIRYTYRGGQLVANINESILDVLDEAVSQRENMLEARFAVNLTPPPAQQGEPAAERNAASPARVIQPVEAKPSFIAHISPALIVIGIFVFLIVAELAYNRKKAKFAEA